MARLPSDRYLIQEIGSMIYLFEEHSEEEIVSFDPFFLEDVRRAQAIIDESSELSPEDKTWAHFWSGYFFANYIR